MQQFSDRRVPLALLWPVIAYALEPSLSIVTEARGKAFGLWETASFWPDDFYRHRPDRHDAEQVDRPIIDRFAAFNTVAGYGVAALPTLSVCASGGFHVHKVRSFRSLWRILPLRSLSMELCGG